MKKIFAGLWVTVFLLGFSSFVFGQSTFEPDTSSYWDDTRDRTSYESSDETDREYTRSSSSSSSNTNNYSTAGDRRDWTKNSSRTDWTSPSYSESRSTGGSNFTHQNGASNSSSRRGRKSGKYFTDKYW